MKAGEKVYLDTSAILAFLDADDNFHDSAVTVWEEALSAEVRFVMTEFVRLECWSLVQRRLGLGAVEDFLNAILPLCQVQQVDDQTFTLLARQVLLTRRKDLSLTDLSSFHCMRDNGITHALAFDKHFKEQGFKIP